MESRLPRQEWPGATSGAAARNAAASAICKDKSEDCTKASPYQLKQAGITDAHKFKTEYGAVPNSQFDICACKNGSIIIKAVGTCGASGPSITTVERWK